MDDKDAGNDDLAYVDDPNGQLFSSQSQDVVEDSDENFENYNDAESGVEPDYTEWVFDDASNQGDVMVDLSNEQALATLKYFTSTADRTNMMTKFHSNDLDLISQLLTDKEKDLEMAAKIGQSLLQRNKSLMEKIEKMEDYLEQTKDNEEQLKYDLQHKNELVKMYYEDDEERSSTSDNSRDDICDDEEMMGLTKRCRDLEKENHNLFSEALELRHMTSEIEEKEENLVLDCIEQLSSAKVQITKLTDEIAQKFEDNVQQQDEITQLINMVVELQKKQKQLGAENEELQHRLLFAQKNETNLHHQLTEMQEKFRETCEMLQENQQEMKTLKSRMESDPIDWLNDSNNSLSLQESLATEIEESVRRDLSFNQDTKRQNKKVFENVRYLNTKSHEALSRSTSGRTSPVSVWSSTSDDRSEAVSSVSFDFDGKSSRKSARKLQIVKPMEGSDTLSKWHNLASQNVRGGLNISSENPISPTQQANASLDLSVEDDRSTVVEKDNVSHESINSKDTRELLTPPKQSTPQNGRLILNSLTTPAEKKKTIITRSSTALNSLRQGRRMLKGQATEGKSKSEVIDMIANAMSKVNVEAQTGKRILSSLQSEKNSKQRALSTTKSPDFKDFVDMPNVSRMLEKAAFAKQEVEQLNAVHEAGVEHEQTKPVLPRKELDRMSGPLGILNRADPENNNEMIVERLYRLSSHDTNASTPKVLTKSSSIDQGKDQDFDSGVSTTGSSDDIGVRRNQSSGSLIDLMMSNKRQTGLRAFGGLPTVMSSSSGLLAQNGPVTTLKESNSKSLEGIDVNSATPIETSKSVETGLDDVRNETKPASSYGGFFSFLGKLT